MKSDNWTLKVKGETKKWKGYKVLKQEKEWQHLKQIGWSVTTHSRQPKCRETVISYKEIQQNSKWEGMKTDNTSCQ